MTDPVAHARVEDLTSPSGAVHAVCSCRWVSPWPSTIEALPTQFLAHQMNPVIPEYVAEIVPSPIFQAPRLGR